MDKPSDPGASLARPPGPGPGSSQPSARAFDAVVFDLDGVIVDTERIVHDVWEETFARYGASFTAEEWATIVGTDKGFDPLSALVARSTLPVPPLARLQEQVLARELELLEGISPLPGVVEWIEGARRLAMGVAVASSSPEAWVKSRLKDVGLGDRFLVVSSRSATLAAKPAPDLYLDACRRLGVEPARAIAVEDSANGLKAARAAGLACLAVPNSITAAHDLGEADLIVESLAAVPIETAVQLLSEKRTS